VYYLHINLITLAYFNCKEHIFLLKNQEQKYLYNSLDETKTLTFYRC